MAFMAIERYFAFQLSIHVLRNAKFCYELRNLDHFGTCTSYVLQRERPFSTLFASAFGSPNFANFQITF